MFDMFKIYKVYVEKHTCTSRKQGSKIVTNNIFSHLKQVAKWVFSTIMMKTYKSFNGGGEYISHEFN